MQKIFYILPSIGVSGGVAIVLQHVNRLISRGYDAAILVVNDGYSIDWFPDNRAAVFKVSDIPMINASGADIVIATHFSTVALAQSIMTDRHVYFVQSDERRFNLGADEFLCCHETYKSNMEFMTEALWIQRWLKEEFQKDAYYVPNGLDESIFRPTKNIEPTTKTRVLLEGSINASFKGMEDAYNAVKDLDCELWIVSNDGVPKDDWRYDRFFSRVPFFDMDTIYSSCDVFLKMSKVEGFFGPPMEAMACGCAAVVGEVTGYDEYICDEYNALVVKQGDVDGARKAVQHLIEDFMLRKKLIANGYETVKNWKWNNSIDLLERVVQGKKIDIHYTETMPNRYMYMEEMNRIMLKLLQEEVSERCGLKNEIEVLKKDIQRISGENTELYQSIASMQSSKFWKLREWHFKVKFVFFHPLNFLKKFFKEKK